MLSCSRSFALLMKIEPSVAQLARYRFFWPSRQSHAHWPIDHTLCDPAIPHPASVALPDVRLTGLLFVIGILLDLALTKPLCGGEPLFSATAPSVSSSPMLANLLFYWCTAALYLVCLFELPMLILSQVPTVRAAACPVGDAWRGRCVMMG